MYGDELIVMEHSKGCALAFGDAVLHVHFPPLYPDAPVSVALSAPMLGPPALARAMDALNEIAQTRAAQGSECVADLAQHARNVLEAVERLESCAGAFSAVVSADPDDDYPPFVDADADADAEAGAEAAAVAVALEQAALEEDQELVLRIDHMNAADAYMTKLRKWAAASGVRVSLYYSADGAKRVRGVLLLAVAPAATISAFLQRLRTEHVDVDSRGRSCRERQSTVLCRRPAPQSGDAIGPGIRSPWSATAYSSPRELAELLERCGCAGMWTGGPRIRT
jgi:hypothetical protein